MADNVISKIVRLIFDKNSGKAVEKDAKESLDKVDKELSGLEKTARKLIGALAAAFAVRKIIDFGKASVKAANDSQRAWAALGNVIDNAGEDFGKLEGSIRASAEAFSAATIHDDDSYAASLQRLVVLTGDVTASTNNMGLVANVAAAFYNGDLAPATDLVAKLMNGQATAAKRLGIETKDAGEALKILAERSMGAASKEASTFSGQLAQVNNMWGDFQKAIGQALTSSDKGVSTLSVLRDVIRSMTDWVGKNRREIGDWVVKAINAAIVGVDGLYRAVLGLTNLFQGSFNVALGAIVGGISMLALGYSKVVEGMSIVARFVSEETADKWKAQAESIALAAKGMSDWADAAVRGGSDQVKKGLQNFLTPVFTPESLGTRGANVPELEVKDPMMTAHERNLDVLSQMDADYWRKRIGLTATGAKKIKQVEKDVTEGIAAEFSERQQLAEKLGSELLSVIDQGVGPAAANKAKENFLQAGEYLIKAGIAALSPTTSWMTGHYLRGATQSGIIGAGWAALSAAAGGPGGSGAPNVGGTGSGAGAISATGASSTAAEEAEAPGVLVNVYVDGLNPRSKPHQDLLAQTNQQIKERYGENSHVTIIPATA